MNPGFAGEALAEGFGEKGLPEVLGSFEVLDVLGRVVAELVVVDRHGRLVDEVERVDSAGGKGEGRRLAGERRRTPRAAAISLCEAAVAIAFQRAKFGPGGVAVAGVLVGGHAGIVARGAAEWMLSC